MLVVLIHLVVVGLLLIVVLVGVAVLVVFFVFSVINFQSQKIITEPKNNCKKQPVLAFLDHFVPRNSC